MSTDGEIKAETETYRVDGKTLRRDAFVLLLLALDVAYGFWNLSQMPARVPTHWGLSGQPDAWGPGWVNAIGVPGVAVAIYVMLLLAPLIDPKRASYALFADTVRFFRLASVLFFIGFHVVVVRASLGDDVDMGRVMRLGVPLLFIALGNRFGKLRHNYFFGIRTPWTLANEEVWVKTHRMAGTVWVVGGLVQLAAAFLPTAPGAAVFVAALVIMVVVPVVYSYQIFPRP